MTLAGNKLNTKFRFIQLSRFGYENLEYQDSFTYAVVSHICILFLRFFTYTLDFPPIHLMQ